MATMVSTFSRKSSSGEMNFAKFSTSPLQTARRKCPKLKLVEEMFVIEAFASGQCRSPHSKGDTVKSVNECSPLPASKMVSQILSKKYGLKIRHRFSRVLI